MFRKITKDENKKVISPEMFVSRLLFRVGADYVTLRTLFKINNMLFTWEIITKSMDVVEKIFKIYISAHHKRIISPTHNIENLRLESSKFNNVFNDPDIKKFTESLNDKGGKLYQFCRYGYQEDVPEHSGFNPTQLIQVVDKIFFAILQNMPAEYQKLISTDRFLVTRVLNNNVGKNNDLLQKALRENNNYI